MEPVELKLMTDHRAFMLPSGFDDMRLDKAENLNLVAPGVPGTFFQEGPRTSGEAIRRPFAHFHDAWVATGCRAERMVRRGSNPTVLRRDLLPLVVIARGDESLPGARNWRTSPTTPAKCAL